MRLVRILILVASLIAGLLLPTMSVFADDPLPTDQIVQPTDPPAIPSTDPAISPSDSTIPPTDPPAIPPTDPLPVPPPPPDTPDIPDDPGWGV